MPSGSTRLYRGPGDCVELPSCMPKHNVFDDNMTPPNLRTFYVKSCWSDISRAVHDYNDQNSGICISNSGFIYFKIRNKHMWNTITDWWSPDQVGLHAANRLFLSKYTEMVTFYSFLFMYYCIAHDSWWLVFASGTITISHPHLYRGTNGYYSFYTSYTMARYQVLITVQLQIVIVIYNYYYNDQ